MTNFSYQQPGISPTGPARSDVKAAPDVFGAAAGFLDKVGTIFDDRARLKAKAAEAAAEAKNDKALDEAAGAIWRTMSAPELDQGAQDIVRTVSDATEARNTGQMSGTRYDILLTREINRVMEKYPDSNFEIMSKLSSIAGADHYLFRAFKDEQALVDSAREQRASRAQAYLNAYDSYASRQPGLDGELGTADDTWAGLKQDVSEAEKMDMGRRILLSSEGLAQEQARFEAMKAEVDAGVALSDASLRENSVRLKDAYTQHGKDTLVPLVSGINSFLQRVSEGDISNEEALQVANLVVGNIRQYRTTYLADARARGMREEEVEVLDKFYTDVETSVNTMLTGDLSYSKIMAQTVTDIQNAAKVDLYRSVESFARIEAAVGPDGIAKFTEYLLQGEIADTSNSIINWVNNPLSAEGMETEQGMAAAEAIRRGNDLTQFGGPAIENALKLHGANYAGRTKTLVEGENLSEDAYRDFANISIELGLAAAKGTPQAIEREVAESVIDNFTTPEALISMQQLKAAEPALYELANRSVANAISTNFSALLFSEARQFGKDITGTPSGATFEYNAEEQRFTVVNNQDKGFSRAGNTAAIMMGGVDASAGNARELQAAQVRATRANLALEYLVNAALTSSGLPEGMDEKAIRNYIASGQIGPDMFPNIQSNRIDGRTQSQVTMQDVMSQFRKEQLEFFDPMSAYANTWADRKYQIQSSEGTDGDYNTLFGYSQNSKFADVTLTDMTLAEIGKWVETSGYGDWVAEKTGGPYATPLGAYQIVWSNVERLARQAGLDFKNTKFSVQLQDMMAQRLIKDREDKGEEWWADWAASMGGPDAE